MYRVVMPATALPRAVFTEIDVAIGRRGANKLQFPNWAVHLFSLVLTQS